ncbi:MAG TPA: DUF1059 domain-containing protein [Acidimicrobiales bacterium]|nr:DUF1059 domain-containing protein [Acidimicrobiales bacterium]
MGHTFACRDNDHACRWKASAATEDELMEKVARHARAKHGVQELTQTLATFLRSGIKQG